jgi:hypothetical protein
MSYFRRESRESSFPADRLPVHIFPALVGSGRILLGMALAGVTTAIMLESRAGGEPLFWWLAGVAYLSSLILVISGIYAVNVIPPRRELAGRYAPTRPAPRPPRVVAQSPESAAGPPAPEAAPSAPGAAPSPPEEPRGRLGDLLVDHWQVLTTEQLSQARDEQERTGHSLVYVLAQKGLLTDEALEDILSLQSAAQDPWHDSPRLS